MGKAIKRTCWGIVGFSILFAVIFHQALFTFFATWSLQAYSISKFGQPLQYENIFFKDHHLVIVKPRLEYEPFFIAESMTFNFQFHLWKRQLNIEIQMEKPHWKFETPLTSQWEQWIQFLNQEEKWIKTQPHLRIKEGLLTWSVEDFSQPYQLKFDLEMNNREGGYVKLYFNELASSDHFLTLQTLKVEEGVELNCNCEKVDCTSLVALSRLLGVDLPPWQILSGSLQGQLKAIFPKMHRPYLEGEMTVENLAFSHHPSQWNLQGKLNLNAQVSPHLNLFLSCSACGKPEGKIQLALHPFENGIQHAKIQCEKLSYLECGFLQTLLTTYWPVFHEVVLEDGEFNAWVEADITQQGLGELYIKQFEASHVRSQLKPWNMICDFEQVRGYGKVHLGKEDFWQSVHAGLHLENGNMQFTSLTPPLPMTDIQAHFFIQQGHVEHSLVTLQIAGLKGKMDVEWGKHKQLLTFKLDGIVGDLAHLFPNALQEGLRKHFYDNHLIVLANLKKQNQSIELGGTLHIQRANMDHMDLIHFGCELKKMQKDSDFKCVPIGWFHAQKLPVEKFLSPFIFGNDVLRISGEAEFKGSFDDQSLLIKYDADDLKIENDNLCIEIPHLHASAPEKLIGSHQINLHTYQYQGILPIQSATYYEKNTGLVFEDIQGLVEFKNHFLRISPIEAYSEGIYFAGDLALDYSDPTLGVFGLKIRCPTLFGKVSQVQHLLAHFDPSSFLHRMPIEGEVSGQGEGLYLHFNFAPQDCQMQAHIQGCITDGALAFEEANMALRGIYMDVDYNHQQQSLKCTDIQGTLLVGKPRRVEEYLFNGDHIHVHPTVQPDIDLDISIKDHNHELLRLVGYTQNEQEGFKSFHINRDISHFSDMYPHVWHCQLKDWTSVEQFEFCSKFDLGSFLQDLCRFRQTGLLFLSPRVIEKISQFLPLAGEGSIALQYHPDQSYTYQLEGLHIKQQGELAEHFGLLKGSKHNKKWMIDQLQWDDWNIYAELNQMEENWRIPFLGLKVGQTLLLGLDGEWLQEEALLRAKLKFCEIDLSKLDDFEALHPFVTKWWPKGTLNAIGEIEWNLLASNLMEGCKISLSAEASNFSLRDCPLHIVQSFQMELQPYHRFSLKNVQLELASQKRESYIDLKQFEYQWPDAISHCDAAFQIPHYQLKTTGETLHHHFPEFLDASVKELMITAKQKGQLKGTLRVKNYNSTHKSWCLELEDGIYTFKNRNYDLKKFNLQVANDKMQFSAFSQQERYPFQIYAEVLWPSCQKGQCKLISENSKPLMIKWENHPQQGWKIRSLIGEFSGCTFLLREDKALQQEREWMCLKGRVAIDFNRLSCALTPSSAEQIQKLKIGALYSLAGHFWINPNRGTTLLETVSFKGNLASEECVLKGYLMHHLQAHLQYVPGRLDLQNLLIEDLAGTVKSANCMVFLDEQRDKWTVRIPQLTIKNLRLNLLREAEVHAQAHAKLRSFILKRIEFQNLEGDLGNIHTWRAEGNLHFLNPLRKNLSNPLLAIPAEIILRLGLNPHVLNPVTGIIYFNLHKEKFYLTRFKDVYSEGRGSKFYLAESPEPSWMDFNGNLSITGIRMKQYNLIFKIAEFFTVSIQGNIQKPQYALQKQSKALRKNKLLPMKIKGSKG